MCRRNSAVPPAKKTSHQIALIKLLAVINLFLLSYALLIYCAFPYQRKKLLKNELIFFLPVESQKRNLAMTQQMIIPAEIYETRSIAIACIICLATVYGCYDV
jgi:hypothetical protein